MSELHEKFHRYLAQTSNDPIGIVVERAEGCWVIAKDGNKFLDFISGIAVTNIGHTHPEVTNAIRKQTDRFLHVMVYGEYIQDVQVELAEKLVTLVESVCEGKWQYYPTNSGTEANEGALKLARKFTGRKKFVAFEGSFHGDTFGSLSVTGREVYRQPFSPLLSDVDFLPFGDVTSLDRIDESVAAVIVEPVQGEAGIIVPPDEFLPALRKRCSDVNAVLILDEVQTGFGRTGKWFAFEHWNTTPDILTVGKSLGGGMPIGGFLSQQKTMKTLSENPPLCHVTTFGGHPVCCASALACLTVMEKQNLPAKAEQMGEKLKAELNSLSVRYSSLITSVRGKGLMLGMQFSTTEKAKAFVKGCLEKRLIVGGTIHTNQVIRIAPPLIISDYELDFAIQVMGSVLKGI